MKTPINVKLHIVKGKQLHSDNFITLKKKIISRRVTAMCRSNMKRPIRNVNERTASKDHEQKQTNFYST